MDVNGSLVDSAFQEVTSNLTSHLMTSSESAIHTGSTFQWPDYLVFVFMLCASCAVGVYYGFYKKATSTEDYLMAGRTMSAIPVALSLYVLTLHSHYPLSSKPLVPIIFVFLLFLLAYFISAFKHVKDKTQEFRNSCPPFNKI